MSIFGRVVYRQSLNNRGDSTVESKSDLPNFRPSDTLLKPVWVALLRDGSHSVSATLPL